MNILPIDIRIQVLATKFTSQTVNHLDYQLKENFFDKSDSIRRDDGNMYYEFATGEVRK